MINNEIKLNVYVDFLIELEKLSKKSNGGCLCTGEAQKLMADVFSKELFEIARKITILRLKHNASVCAPIPAFIKTIKYMVEKKWIELIP